MRLDLGFETVISGQIIVHVEPRQLAFGVNMEFGFKIRRIRQRRGVKVNFTGVVICLKRHGRAARIAKMARDSLG